MTPIIFDLDGTLIDSAPDLHAAAVNMLAAESLPGITLAQTRQFIGNGVPTLVARIMNASGIPADPLRHTELVTSFLGFYDKEPATRTALYPGVMAALERFAAENRPMGICTNKPEAPTRKILDAFDLSRFMGVVIGGDTLSVKKPDPAPLQAALDALGADTCLYVGDSEVDAETAQALSLPFALYEHGYRKSPVDQIAHTYLFGHFDDLAMALPS